MAADDAGTIRSHQEDRFRGYGSPRGMREELARRSVAGYGLADLGYLARLLDCSGPGPVIAPPAGWRLQCPDCRELDGFHDPGCTLRPPPVPVRDENLDRRVPGVKGQPGLLEEAVRRRDPGLLTGIRKPSRTEARPLPEADPGSIGGHRAPDRGRAGCPDGETCHRDCLPQTCFRVHHGTPLSLAGYPGNRWPDEIKSAYADGGN